MKKLNRMCNRTLEGSLFNSFRPPAIRELIVLMIASPTLAPAVLSSMIGNNIDCAMIDTSVYQHIITSNPVDVPPAP